MLISIHRPSALIEEIVAVAHSYWIGFPFPLPPIWQLISCNGNRIAPSRKIDKKNKIQSGENEHRSFKVVGRLPTISVIVIPQRSMLMTELVKVDSGKRKKV